MDAQQSPPQEPQSSAPAAHSPSHVVLQQNGSAAHTHSWTSRSSQPGVPLEMQQEPSPAQKPQSCGQSSQVSAPLHSPSPQMGSMPPQSAPQSASASPAQMPSQFTSQQYGSNSQTQSWMSISSQPGVPLLSQQSPAQSPQSSAQVAQVSSALHSPSPHHGSPAHSGHISAASSAQSWSQAVSQQNGSASHTVAWQSASSQPGVPLAAQQSPAATLQSASQ